MPPVESFTFDALTCDGNATQGLFPESEALFCVLEMIL